MTESWLRSEGSQPTQSGRSLGYDVCIPNETSERHSIRASTGAASPRGTIVALGSSDR